jgi:hypothetical protein
MVLPQARLRDQTGKWGPIFSHAVAQTIVFRRLWVYCTADDLVGVFEAGNYYYNQTCR